MEKEFESLEKIKEEFGCDPAYYGLNLDFEILQQALTELKAIKEAEPSEAMECSLKLYKMVESAGNGNGFSLNEAWKYHKTIKQYLLKAQEQEEDIIHYKGTVANYRRDIVLLKEIKNEQEKALRIIFEKNVDINYLRFEAIDVKQYNDYIQQLNKVSTISHWCLTQEEFELLKRWIEK